MKESNELNELFELCKQVYEATGWKQSPNISQLYEYWDDYDELCVISIEDADDTLVPAYTSDHLLEKLKHTADEHAGDQLHVFTDTKGWSAKMTVNYTDEDDRYHFHETSNGYGHDTPLNALLKLTLKLHEEGLL